MFLLQKFFSNIVTRRLPRTFLFLFPLFYSPSFSSCLFPWSLFRPSSFLLIFSLSCLLLPSFFPCLSLLLFLCFSFFLSLTHTHIFFLISLSIFGFFAVLVTLINCLRRTNNTSFCSLHAPYDRGGLDTRRVSIFQKFLSLWFVLLICAYLRIRTCVLQCKIWVLIKPYISHKTKRFNHDLKA